MKTMLIADKDLLVVHCLNRLSIGLTQFSYYNEENSESMNTRLCSPISCVWWRHSLAANLWSREEEAILQIT